MTVFGVDPRVIRDNAGPAQLSLENSHLDGLVGELTRKWRKKMDVQVVAHPRALQKEKDYMQDLNRKAGHLSKHHVFAAEPMRRARAFYGLEAVIDRYGKAGFPELGHKTQNHVDELNKFKRVYKAGFVSAARRLCARDHTTLAKVGMGASVHEPSNQDKRAHRRLHGRAIESPSDDMFAGDSCDEDEEEPDIGVIKDGHNIF
jgi:hypothetical protein